jgi:predicted RNase H-like nuclease (RuvC/YqgF family)
LGSDGDEDPSEKLKVRLAAAAEQYKTEILDDHNKNKQADAKKIKKLEAQLAGSKKEIRDLEAEAEEWKTKFEEADAVLQPIINFTRK